MQNIKIAIIHDWLTGMRGGEKCLEVFCELFPKATIFTLVYNKKNTSSIIRDMDIRTSFLQKIPTIYKYYRNFLPFFPFAIESFDFSGYDLILSSSHCVAKGIKKPKGALHISYCYTPMRYVWDFFDEYFLDINFLKRWIISKVIEWLKRWDIRSNKQVDYFVAISENVKNRIWRYYNRTSDVIYPPVDIDLHKGEVCDKGFYLIVSALVPYKRIDVAIRAFNDNKKPLTIVGTGTEYDRLSKLSHENIKLVGWASDDELCKYYAECKALIFPGVEDFGIVPLEAQAYGKPVIAFGKGGALETVAPLAKEAPDERLNATGVFFNEQSAASLNNAIKIFEQNMRLFNPDKIRENVVRFNKDRFKLEIYEYIQDKWERHRKE